MVTSSRPDNGIEPEPTADAPHNGAPLPPHPLEPLLKSIAELRAAFGHYVKVRGDRVAAAFRRIVFWIVVGLVAALVSIAFIVTAAVMAFRGVAYGLAWSLGAQAWVGELLTGILFLTVVGVGVWFGLGRWERAAARKLAKTYQRWRESTPRSTSPRDHDHE